MDPLSITVSVLTLITISAQVSGLVRQFRDEVNVVDTTLNGILNDVDGFQQVLESMKETFDQKDIRGDLQTTGHVGSHWKNLSRSLSDGENTLEQLRSLIVSVSRSAKFLDAPRKHLRFKSAIAQIAEFREQIQSYRAALQLSLSTVILWNQTTLQKATDQIPEKVIPDLNKLYDEFRALGTTLNAKIEKLQNTVADQGYHAESELISMTNLKECVQSAADVVSTASTTLAPETSERASVKYGSDFGDVFKKESNEPMQRWISSNTVYEFEDAEAPAPDPSETSIGEAFTEYQSDSDSDIENELVRALFNNGKKRKKDGDLQGAARTLQNCLSRFPTTSTYSSITSSQTTSITGVSKAELLELLTETYCLQGAWSDAKLTMKEKLAITEHQTGRKSERYLWDTYKLCEVMVKTKDYAEAHLHGRQSLRGFKKLREQGLDGYEKSLTLLILICSEQGNSEEEEAYTALLESHQSNMKDRCTDLELGLTVDENLVDAPVDTLLLRSARESLNHDVEAGYGRRLRSPIKSASSRSLESAAAKHHGSHPVLDEAARSTRSENVPPSIGAGSYTPEISDPSTPTLQEKSPPEGLALARESPLSRSSSSPRLRNKNFTPFRPAGRDYGSDSIPLKSVDFAPPSSSTPKVSNSRNVTAKDASRRNGVTIEAKDYEEVSDSEVSTSYTKLLVALCKEEFGRKPFFMIARGREGYNCIVTLASNTHGENKKEEVVKVAGYQSRDEAKQAGATKAYDLLTSRLAKLRGTIPSETATTPNPVPDRSSDKEIYMRPAQTRLDPPPYTPDDKPSSITSPVPEILVSPTLDSTPFATFVPSTFAHDVTVRRAASESHVSRHKSSMKDVSAIDGKQNAPNSWVPSQGNLDPRSLTHRRAASTTTRPAEWTAGDDPIHAWPRQLTKTSQPVHALPDKTHQIKSAAQPNVTFDAMESSVIKPDHSNSDHTTSTSRSFLSKTFSLQDRRSKSDDANLAKKKSLRAMLLPSSLIRSPSLKREDSISKINSAPVTICPLCNLSLFSLSAEDASLHVNSCLDRSFSQTVQEGHTVFELPGSDLTFTAAELPAPVNPQRLMHSIEYTRAPKIPVTDPDTLSNLHRAYSKRDLCMNKFEASISLQPSSTLYNRGTLQVSQRKVLLLGDPQCGKTWLSRAWCGSTFIEAHSRCVFFTKVLDGMEFILHDRTALEFIRDNMRRAYPGNLPVVLLCFDISSVESFENVERRWNHEADLYPENVPKILVGCKKDLKADTARSVWTRDAYKMTAKINAKAYFETSAVTKEGLEALFSHVAQMSAR